MADIFEEISKEVQQEKWAALWHKYQKQISTFCIAVLVLSLLGWYWQYRQTEITGEASQAYTSAVFQLDMNNPTGALHSLEGTAQKSGHTYVDLAGLLGGSLLRQTGDQEGAAAAYEMVVKNADAAGLKDLALLKLLYVKADMKSYEDVLARVDALTGETCVWRNLALELKAFALSELGKHQEAQDILKTLGARGGSVGERAFFEMGQF